MVARFEATWDDHMSRVNLDRHWVEASPADTEPMHTARYCAGPLTQEYQMRDLEKMLLKGAIETSHTKSAETIELAQERREPNPRYCVLWKLNTVIWRDVYLFPHMDDCNNLLGEEAVLSTLRITVGTGKSRLKTMVKKLHLYLTPRISLLCTDGIWITEWFKQVSASDTCCSFRGPVAVCTGISWRYCRSQSLCNGSHRACWACKNAFMRRRSSPEAEAVEHLFWPNWSLVPNNSLKGAWRLRYIQRIASKNCVLQGMLTIWNCS